MSFKPVFIRSIVFCRGEPVNSGIPCYNETMSEPSKRSAVFNLLLAAASFVVVVAGMKAASSILVLFLLAAFIAVICAPPLFWLQRKGVPRILALLLVIGMVLGVVLILGTIVGTSLNNFTRDWPSYQAKLHGQTVELFESLKDKGLNIDEEGFSEAFNPGSAMKLVTGILTGLGGVLTNGFLILFTVIFILLEASDFPVKLRAISPGQSKTLEFFSIFVANIKRYMALKTLISLVTGSAVAIWLSILGVDYPLLWGMLAFLFNFVPNIGSIISAIPAVLLAFLQLGPGSALLAALGYLVINVSMGNLIEPRVMGRGLGLSTLVVFLSLVFWGWVLGPVGMLLSVPLTMIAKIAFDSNEFTKPLAVLLGTGTAAQLILNSREKQKNDDSPEKNPED